MIKPENLRFRHLKFIDNKLFANNEDTGIKIEEVKPEGIENISLWYIRFTDGGLSTYPYNLTRAKENAKIIYLERVRKAVEGSSGELF